jgi:hypothetical protein
MTTIPSDSQTPKQAAEESQQERVLGSEVFAQAQAIGRALATIPHLTAHDIRLLARTIADRHVGTLAGMQSAEATNLRSEYEQTLQAAFEEATK